MPLTAPDIRYHEGTLCAPLDMEGQLRSVIEWRVDNRSKCLRTHAMHFRTLVATGESFIDSVSSWPPLALCEPKLNPLRSYQTQAREAWMETQRGVVVMPTGTGKTELALSIISSMQCSVLVVCPLRALMYQWKERLQQAFQSKVGVIGDTHFHQHPITVTTYKSACLKMPQLGNQFELLVFDECHNLPGTMLGDSARMSAAPYRLGLTATPQRRDEADYDMLIGPQVFNLPLDKVPPESIAEYDVKRVPVELNEDERKRYRELGATIRVYVSERRKDDPRFKWTDSHGENAADLAARRALKAHRARKALEDRASSKIAVLEELLAYHAEEQTIVFTGSNQMAYEISTHFLIPCLLDHCDSKERAFILDGFRTGCFKAIVANQVLDEGIDVPSAKIAIVLGGKSTTQQAIQRLGRILRPDRGTRARLYEVVCKDTGEVKSSRKRRDTDAYQRTGNLHI